MSNLPAHSAAFGAPGIEPCWTSSAKAGVGTACHISCRLWFTQHRHGKKRHRSTTCFRPDSRRPRGRRGAFVRKKKACTEFLYPASDWF
ncbi:MAG TPA: hypothetical protein VNN22_24665 [Verrucomicrobiae bacterium]|nr:hypothetical protein [Verrucomicrobiae bacterium]